jgi:hypothetical protein
MKRSFSRKQMKLLITVSMTQAALLGSQLSMEGDHSAVTPTSRSLRAHTDANEAAKRHGKRRDIREVRGLDTRARKSRRVLFVFLPYLITLYK